MKIEFVCPAAEDSTFLRSRAIATLAALTPPHVEVSLQDDIVGALEPERDLDFGADLAAITVSTKTARRAYQLADAYRSRGVRVVLGGIHPSVLPEEGLAHADAVVVGEAEESWPRVVADLERGELQRIYRQGTPPDFSSAPHPRWDLFRSRRYLPIVTTQASRGCPFDCEFCSVTPIFGHRWRLRRIEDLVAELRALERRWVMFVDDNILGDLTYARELFRALRPLGLTWFAQASLHGLRDRRNVELMSASGCRGLFVGFESVSSESLRACGKRQNSPEHYLEIVRLLHEHGIAVWGSFVFGLDEDTPDIFARTVELAARARLFMALFAMLTPYPGTRLYQRLAVESRLLDERWWLQPGGADRPLLRPRRMTPEQLVEGWRWAWQEFYGASSIVRRLPRLRGASLFELLAFLPMNLLQRRLAAEKIVGGASFFLRDR